MQQLHLVSNGDVAVLQEICPPRIATCARRVASAVGRAVAAQAPPRSFIAIGARCGGTVCRRPSSWRLLRGRGVPFGLWSACACRQFGRAPWGAWGTQPGALCDVRRRLELVHRAEAASFAACERVDCLQSWMSSVAHALGAPTRRGGWVAASGASRGRVRSAGVVAQGYARLLVWGRSGRPCLRSRAGLAIGSRSQATCRACSARA